MTSYASTNVNNSKQINEQEIYELIRTGGDHKDLVTEARLLGKQSETYDKNKIKVPAVLWYSTFTSYKDTKHLSSLTNFIYCDIDSVEDIDKTKDKLKQIPYIRAIWISFGGNGLGFSVKCDILTQFQLKSMKRIGVKVGTINRYWGEFKEDVMIMNDNIRENG